MLDEGRPAAALRRLAERLERLPGAAGVEVAEAMVVVDTDSQHSPVN